MSVNLCTYAGGTRGNIFRTGLWSNGCLFLEKNGLSDKWPSVPAGQLSNYRSFGLMVIRTIAWHRLLHICPSWKMDCSSNAPPEASFPWIKVSEFILNLFKGQRMGGCQILYKLQSPLRQIGDIYFNKTHDDLITEKNLHVMLLGGIWLNSTAGVATLIEACPPNYDF